MLLAETGYPTGGSYSLIQNLSISPLPELVPPSTGDFVSADDNIQVSKTIFQIRNVFFLAFFTFMSTRDAEPKVKLSYKNENVYTGVYLAKSFTKSCQIFCFQVKRVIPSSKLQENYKFTVKVNNSHVYMQTETDKTSSVLKSPECVPQKWLHKPSEEEISKFSLKISEYEQHAKNVRKILLDGWLSEVVSEQQRATDLVQKLNFLRKTKENIWPCRDCSNLSMLPFISIEI